MYFIAYARRSTRMWRHSEYSGGTSILGAKCEGQNRSTNNGTILGSTCRVLSTACRCRSWLESWFEVSMSSVRGICLSASLFFQCFEFRYRREGRAKDVDFASIGVVVDVFSGVS